MTKEEGKILNLAIEEYDDDWEVSTQEIDFDELGIYFKVYDMSECPEDAIIGRDLFTAEEYIEALKKGIELAQMGYTDIKYTTVKVEKEEW